MFAHYQPERVSSLPAAHRRSSPRALCLLQPELRPDADAWARAAEARAALGEHTAGPSSERTRSARREPALTITAMTAISAGSAGSANSHRTGSQGTSSGLGDRITDLATWLGQRRLGRRGLCFRLECLPLDDAAPRLDPGLDISLAEQRWLIDLWSRGERLTHFQRLGLAPTHDLAAIRRAYLASCQRLHPDRYYGKHIGRFASALVDLFHRARAAQVYLSDPRRCSRYLAQLAAAGHPVAEPDARVDPVAVS